jgi:uncharacterized protein YkwD
VLSSTPKHARPAGRVRILCAALGALVVLALAALVGTWVMAPPGPGGQATAGVAATASLPDATTGLLAGPNSQPASPSVPPVPTPAPSPSVTSSRTRTAVPTPAPARTTARPPANASFEDQVLALVNQERGKAGCQPVTPDSRLVTAARAHSQDMATNNYFAHNTPSGVDPGTRITNAGYHWSAWGENIAAGQPDPASVMHAWMNSDGHRKNILTCDFRNLGVGLAYNGERRPYWTQDFGTLA